MSATPSQNRQCMTQIDLREFPVRLRELDYRRLTIWEKDYRCISRDKLSLEEIETMREICDFICGPSENARSVT